MSDEIALYEIRKGLDALYQKGDVIELRAPRNPDVQFSANKSGFFNDLDILARAIHSVNTEYEQSVYTTLNPLNPTWATVNNKAYVGSACMRDELDAANLPLEPRMKKSTMWETGKEHWSMRMAEDEDVLKRRWILVDIDAGQPTNTNSSDAEHANTLAMAKAVIDKLIKDGFPAPALANSGNGHHVLVRVDLPNDSESQALVRRFLKALAQRFNTQFGTAAVDEGVFNAARITKAIGSFVYKGKHSAVRPQRRSGLINPPSRKFATIAQLTEVAAEYTLKPGENLSSNSGAGGIVLEDAALQKQLDRVKEFLNFHEIEFGEMQQTDGNIVIPCTCPNSEKHSMNGGALECAAILFADGGLGFCCQHAHCQELRSWKGMEAFIENQTGRVTKCLYGKLYIGTRCITGHTVPIVVHRTAKLTEGERATELLTSLKSSCPVPIADVMIAATDRHISCRTVQRHYTLAGVSSRRIGPQDFLVTSE